jgi:DNA-binding NarL/FixJ family response regulator
MTSGVRIVVADSQAMFRELLVQLLKQAQFQVEIVGEVSTGYQLLSLCEKEQPEIAIFDVDLPELSGLSLAQEITQRWPAIRLVAYTDSLNETVPVQMIQQGVHAFLQKKDGLNELLRAIRLVGAGGNYYSSRGRDWVRRAVQHTFARKQLTLQEIKVLQLIAEGFSTKEIGGKLGISAKTAETHRTNLMEKLNIHNVAMLTRHAITLGLVRCRNQEEEENKGFKTSGVHPHSNRVKPLEEKRKQTSSRLWRLTRSLQDDTIDLV